MRENQTLQNLTLVKFLIATSSLKKFDLFSTNAPVLHPLKTSENFRFSDVFSGYGSGTFVENGLICLEIIVKYQIALFLELLLVCPDAVRQKTMTGTA